MDGFGRPTTSTNNHSIEPGPISRFLSRGQGNAVSLRQLEALTGYDGRTVRLMIQRERLKGTPILADNQNGYYLPASPEERERCVRSMLHRSAEIRKAAEAINQADAWRG